jgi:hypothetical protein
MTHGNGNGNIRPQPNDQAPLKEREQLPPPRVRRPIHECGRAVHIESCIPHAHVVVYANGVEVVGEERPWVSFDDIDLTRPLVVGDSITATQEAFGFTSVQSYQPVIVDHQPGSLDKPTVGPTIYARGQVVPVGGLAPSTHVEVYQASTQPVPIVASNLVGTAECTGAGVAVTTVPLNEGWFVAARPVSCPGTAHEILSPPSDSLKVPPEPSPMLPPTHDPWIPGNDTATFHGLYIGAEVTLTDTTVNSVVLDGLANGPDNWGRVQPPFKATHGYSPRQKLCTASPPGPSDKPTGTLATPALLTPICSGEREVTVLNTTLNAALVLYRVGTPLPIGFGGAALGEAILSIGPAFTLNVGDELYVRQYIGSAISNPSNHVHLVDCRNVITQHNDNRRTGAYLHETTLTPATVSGPGFGRLYERAVDGSPYAQILYVRNVPGTRLGTKNLFIVATSTNMV